MNRRLDPRKPPAVASTRAELVLALIIVFAVMAIGAFGFRPASGQTVAEPTLLLEQLDGDVTEACGLVLVLRRHTEEPHAVALAVCPLFRDGFEP